MRPCACSARSPLCGAIFRLTLFFLPLSPLCLPPHSHELEAQRLNAPTAHDWTGNLTTAVKDQQQCGSCWAFSATEQIESMGIQTGKFGREQTLSVQQIVACDKVDQGCNGGDTPTAYASVIKAKGIEDGKKYPYTAGGGKNGKCLFKDHKPVVTNIAAFNYVGKTNETAMAAYVGQTAPLSICVDAESWQTYKSGLVGPKTCKTQLDHCVQVVGYDMTKVCYNLKIQSCARRQSRHARSVLTTRTPLLSTSLSLSLSSRAHTHTHTHTHTHRRITSTTTGRSATRGTRIGVRRDSSMSRWGTTLAVSRPSRPR